MRKTSRFFICIIALISFIIWVPTSFAQSSYFSNTPDRPLSCSVCHSSASVSCAACHQHGSRNLSAITDQSTYAPGDQITVSIGGSSSNRPGWVRTILYDQDGNEIARSTGPSGMGGGPEFPGPITLTAPSPDVPGTYTWSASWYGNSFRNGASSGNFVPDPNNPDHGQIIIFTNDFDVIAQCDTNAPIINTPANLTITLPAGSSGPFSISDPEIQNFLNSASATDTEDGNLPVTNNAPSEFPVGTTQVTFFATDSCGNETSATASVTIEVADNSLPVVTAPAPIEVTAQLCENSVLATNPVIAAFLNGATAFDVEDGDVTSSISNDAPVEFPAGTETTVTFTASDSLGENGTATATVKVNETPNTEPVVTAPDAITIMVPAGTTSVPATDPDIAAFLNNATAFDTEDGDVTASIINDAPGDFPMGTTSVTFSVSDNCGVSANAVSMITIQEEGGNIAPVINVPDQITVDAQLCATSMPATDPTIVAFLNGATAFDAEDGDVTASITNDAPSDFPIGTTPVTFSVTDSDGATTTGVASVMVIGANTAPVLIGPSPLSITVTAGTITVPKTDTAIAAFLNSATATDAEDGDFPSSAITNNAPVDFPMGESTVTFSVTDSCGLTATANSTVTITENQLSYEETDDDIVDDENEYYKENNGHKNRKYEKENKYLNKETRSSTKLRLLREKDDD
jgi:hypothetical protein